MAQWSTRINQVIFAVLDVLWTMGLNRDKTSEVFCINTKQQQLAMLATIEERRANTEEDADWLQ